MFKTVFLVGAYNKYWGLTVSVCLNMNIQLGQISTAYSIGGQLSISLEIVRHKNKIAEGYIAWPHLYPET